jgi:hypothetical protein
MIGLYVVYSVRSEQGVGVGRSYLTVDREPQSMEDIRHIEAALIEKNGPLDSLFLTNWKVLPATTMKGDQTDGDISAKTARMAEAGERQETDCEPQDRSGEAR